MKILLIILSIAGAIGLMLFGMKLFSEALQKLAGKGIRKLLNKATANRFKSFLTGFAITGLIQSSSATTVLIVSFVNAGLLTLKQAIGTIFGANLGTTVTAWIISVLGFSLALDQWALALLGAAIPFYFFLHKRMKPYGELIVGFAMIFLGLQFLKITIPPPEAQNFFIGTLGTIASTGLARVLIFMFAGLLITAFIQSSSATFALILVMLNHEWFDFSAALAMVIGINIGTTFTALIASMVTNDSAKRAALSHLIFNVFGAVLALLLFNPSVSVLQWIAALFGHTTDLTDISIISALLAVYHTLFNLITALILINFIPLIIRFINHVITPRRHKESYSLKYLSTNIATSELSLLQARKMIQSFSLRTEAMFGFVPQLLVEKDEKKFDKLSKAIHKNEDYSDVLEEEINTYIARLSESDLSPDSAVKAQSLLKIISNLESINDQCLKISALIEKKNREKAWFTPEMRAEVGQMFHLVLEALSLTNLNLEKQDDLPDLSMIYEQESLIDDLRHELLKRNNERLKGGEIPYATATYYSDFIAISEKIGDMTLNINQAITRK